MSGNIINFRSLFCDKCGSKENTYFIQAVIALTVLGVQLTPIEGYAVSKIKLGYLILTPFLLYRLPLKNKDAILYGGLFICSLLISMLFSNGRFSTTSFVYTLFFTIAYMYYCSLLSNAAFSLKSYLAFIRKAICFSTYFLIFQQVSKLLHLPVFWLINAPVAWKSPSFFIEASHYARVMTVAFYVFIELLQHSYGKTIKISWLWKNERRIVFCFIYSMLTMGSATGIVGLTLIILYVSLQTRKTISICILVSSFLIYNYFLQNYEPVQRFVDAIQATSTLDMEKVVITDNSAAARIGIFFAFWENFQPSEFDFWFGVGSYSDKVNFGILNVYGAFVWLTQLFMLFRCAFRGVFKMEFILFVLLFAMTAGNVAYVWTAIYLLTTLKFVEKHERITTNPIVSLDSKLYMS